MFFTILVLAGCHQCGSNTKPVAPESSEDQREYDFWIGQNGEISYDGALLLFLQRKYMQDPLGDDNFAQLAATTAIDFNYPAVKLRQPTLLLLFGMPDYWRLGNDYLAFAYLRGSTLAVVILNSYRFVTSIGLNNVSAFQPNGWHKMNSDNAATKPYKGPE